MSVVVGHVTYLKDGMLAEQICGWRYLSSESKQQRWKLENFRKSQEKLKYVHLHIQSKETDGRDDKLGIFQKM